jgi:hypothetical protein
MGVEVADHPTATVEEDDERSSCSARGRCVVPRRDGAVTTVDHEVTDRPDRDRSPGRSAGAGSRQSSALCHRRIDSVAVDSLLEAQDHGEVRIENLAVDTAFAAGQPDSGTVRQRIEQPGETVLDADGEVVR